MPTRSGRHASASHASNNASLRFPSDRYSSRRNPASRPSARSRPAGPVPSSEPSPAHAILNATATAIVFKFCERNPKIVKRWPSPCHHDTPRNTSKS